MTPRNEPMGMGIVERTRKNLDFIAEARRAGADVHEVTHLLNSLLGLVVLPWERVDRNILSAKVLDLKGQDWPMPTTLYGRTPKTLRALVRHLRNAMVHGHFEFVGAEELFSPDSLEPREVKIVMTDGPCQHVTNWKAEINGEDLYLFCKSFIDHIEGKIKNGPAK